MSFKHLPTGPNVPHDVYVIIEIPAQKEPVKYEVNKELDVVYVDRFMTTPMFYPANYGYLSQTLADDGDPLDALVITPYPIAVGAVVRSRPVGVLNMKDEGGEDAKLLCVAHNKLTTLYDSIQNYTDVDKMLLQQIEHFFNHYKDLESNKWVEVKEWGHKQVAEEMILTSVRLYQETQN